MLIQLLVLTLIRLGGIITVLNRNKSYKGHIMDNSFITPPDHVGFLAKKIFSNTDKITDGSIAYLAPNGGGPIKSHSHSHDHLFYVIKGEARVEYEDKIVIIKENSSYLVDGSKLHSVWNNLDSETIMLGFTAEK